MQDAAAHGDKSFLTISPSLSTHLSISIMDERMRSNTRSERLDAAGIRERLPSWQQVDDECKSPASSVCVSYDYTELQSTVAAEALAPNDCSSPPPVSRPMLSPFDSSSIPSSPCTAALPPRASFHAISTTAAPMSPIQDMFRSLHVTRSPRASHSTSSFSRAPLDAQDLVQLRDWLIKTSLCGANPMLPPVPTMDSPQQQPSLLGGFSPMWPSTMHAADYPAAMHFMDVSHRTLKADAASLSAAPYGCRASSLMMPLPRESVAVLIDAVRGSTLQEDAKCQFLFDLFDVNHVGVLLKDSVMAFLEATLVANHVKCLGEMNLTDMVDKLFQRSANPEQMTYQEFRLAFGGVVTAAPSTGGAIQAPAGSARDDEFSMMSSMHSLHLRPQQHEEGHTSFHLRASSVGPRRKSAIDKIMAAYRKHDAEVCWLFVYAVLMVVAFFIKAVYVPYDIAVGYAPRIAKGFAQVIMVDTLFLLFPMCRSVVTFLRQFAWISSRLPLDQNIEFHKIGGLVMLVASVAHSIAWVVIVYYARTVPLDVWEESRFSNLWYVREESLVLLTRRTPIWSGMVMLLIAMVAAPMTHPSFRRGNFNIFWVTHLLFVPFLLLILIHGLAMWLQAPQAWFWVLPPCLLYFIEKRYRVSNIFGGRTSISRVHLASDTVAIFLDKPKHFHFQPGMYLYLNVPILSRYEWHPFTISSAPEDPHLSVHVRNAGDWTGALHQLLSQVKLKHAPHANLDTPASEAMSPYPSVCIDGPVGAPSQDYFRYKTVVFVGAGIGVTPFASILRSIVHQWQGFRCACCGNVSFPRSFRLEKIYFYWLTREQEALTWFRETMNQLTALDTENRLEIHNYYSPLKRESVVAPLRALQTFIHDMDGQDFISGLATKHVTHFGRPDWKHELRRIARQRRQHTQQQQQQQRDGAAERGELPTISNESVIRKKDEVGVFFCGPKPLGRVIHDQCAQFNANERGAEVIFDFHSENF